MAIKRQNRVTNDNLSQTRSEKFNLWMRRGIEDVYFQREAMINFWTILGGVAVAALLTQTSNLIHRIQLGDWHLILYFMTSIFLIVNSWVQYVWGTLVLKVPITIMHTLLTLTNLIFLSILCLQLINPPLFFLAGGIYILFSVFLQANLVQSGAMASLPQSRIKANRNTYFMYIGFMVLCFLAAIHLSCLPSFYTELGWGVFASTASLIAMVQQHFVMKNERKVFGVP